MNTNGNKCGRLGWAGIRVWSTPETPECPLFGELDKKWQRLSQGLFLFRVYSCPFVD